MHGYSVPFMRQMYKEENRLKTFKNWPHQTGNCNAVEMAKAGFYFIGDEELSDDVRCFLCLKELNGWSDNDCPFKEHLSHSSQCFFANLNKPESKLNVEEFLNCVKLSLINIIEFDFNEKKKIEEEFIMEFGKD